MYCPVLSWYKVVRSGTRWYMTVQGTVYGGTWRYMTGQEEGLGPAGPAGFRVGHGPGGEQGVRCGQTGPGRTGPGRPGRVGGWGVSAPPQARATRPILAHGRTTGRARPFRLAARAFMFQPGFLRPEFPAGISGRHFRHDLGQRAPGPGHLGRCVGGLWPARDHGSACAATATGRAM